MFGILGNSLRNSSRFISPIPFIRNEIPFLLKLYQIKPLKKINDFFSRDSNLSKNSIQSWSLFFWYFLLNLVTHLATFSDSWRKSVSKDVTFSTIREKEQRSCTVTVYSNCCLKCKLSNDILRQMCKSKQLGCF